MQSIKIGKLTARGIIPVLFVLGLILYYLQINTELGELTMYTAVGYGVYWLILDTAYKLKQLNFI